MTSWVRFLLSIPILIFPSIAVLSVFPILAVSVVVAVLALVHVDAIDEHTEIGDVLIVTDVVDESKLALAGIVCPADIDAEVGGAGYKLGVGDHADGGGVENDVIEMPTKEVDGCV